MVRTANEARASRAQKLTYRHHITQLERADNNKFDTTNTVAANDKNQGHIITYHTSTQLRLPSRRVHQTTMTTNKARRPGSDRVTNDWQAQHNDDDDSLHTAATQDNNAMRDNNDNDMGHPEHRKGWQRQEKRAQTTHFDSFGP